MGFLARHSPWLTLVSYSLVAGVMSSMSAQLGKTMLWLLRLTPSSVATVSHSLRALNSLADACQACVWLGVMQTESYVCPICVPVPPDTRAGLEALPASTGLGTGPSGLSLGLGLPEAGLPLSSKAKP